MLTFHGVPAEVWGALDENADYAPQSLQDEGFIHTTAGIDDFIATMNRYYRADRRPYVALIIDLDRVRARWDVARYPNLPGEFPHIHGALNRDAVVEMVLVPRDDAGNFTAPAGAR